MINPLSKIAFNIKNLGKSKLDFSHSLSTTAGFGDLQCIHCKIVQPNSNGKYQSKELVRFGTLLAPTFGKVKAKEYAEVVPVSDLFECIAPAMAQAPYTNGAGEVVDCKYFPRMTLGLLSRFIMIGARIELFMQVENGVEGVKTVMIPKNSVTFGEVVSQAANDGLVSFQNGTIGNGGLFYRGNSAVLNTSSCFAGFDGLWLNLGWLNDNWFSALGNRYAPPSEIREHNYYIPIANNDFNSLFGQFQDEAGYNQEQGGQIIYETAYKHLNLEKCDHVLDFQVGNHVYSLGIMLSAFGKRMRKAIIGSHKQVNMMSYTSHEIVTLTALYKAYFDFFAITRYQNYEMSPLRRFTRTVDAGANVSGDEMNFDPNCDKYIYSDVFVNWLVELGRMWYTEQQDAVGAMLTSTAMSPELGLANQFIDVDGTGAHITEVNKQGVESDVGANGHAFINAIVHGQLDAEYLQKYYKWVNQKSVLGMAIADRLRAEGLGKFVDSCKSNFIGFHEELLPINDVVSTSDTFNNGYGSLLGEYGGRGLALYRTKQQSYSTDEMSVVVGLLTIIPEAGYLQSIDPQSYTIKKTDCILPEFDGMGFEAMRKSLICGAINWASQTGIDNVDESDSAESVVGLLPRGSHLKLAHSINNGDITLRSARDGYLRYTLDRFINLGDYEGKKIVDTGNFERWDYYPTMKAKNLPLGGYHYRFLCKYPWMGNYNRIFANEGKGEEKTFWYGYNINALASELGFELCYDESDNFIVHGLITAPVWSPCKPIEESFETFADGEKPNASFEHV